MATRYPPGEAIEEFERNIGSYENWVPEGTMMEGPENIWGLIDICNCYFRLGNMSKTEECAEAYAKLFLDKIPETHKWGKDRNYFGYRYHRVLLNLYLELGSYEKARYHAEKGIECYIRHSGSLTIMRIGRMNVHAHFMANAAIVISKTGNNKRARELLTSIHDIRYRGGRIFPMTKRIEMFNRLVDILPSVNMKMQKKHWTRILGRTTCHTALGLLLGLGACRKFSEHTKLT